MYILYIQIPIVSEQRSVTYILSYNHGKNTSQQSRPPSFCQVQPTIKSTQKLLISLNTQMGMPLINSKLNIQSDQMSISFQSYPGMQTPRPTPLCHSQSVYTY